MTQIIHNLAVGRYTEADKMSKQGWSILCLVSSNVSLPDNATHIKLADGTNTRSDVEQAINFVLNEWRANRKVFVCCRHGMNRSVLIASAALTLSGQCEWLSQGLLMVGRQRQVAAPRNDTLLSVLETVMKMREER